MFITETITTVKCQICEKQGLIPEMPSKGTGRRVVVCQNEYVTHYRVGTRDYLVHSFTRVPELILN